MKFRIAVVQFKIKQFSPEDNLKKAEEFTKKAAYSKAQVIVFPEDFITGPIMKKKKFVDFNGKYIRHFQNLAKKYSIDIVSGSWIEGDTRGWYNTSYYIDRSGKINGKYRKINLWLGERSYITPGNKISVFNTKFGRAGLIICWDLAFPEIFRKMVNMGVRIVYCPSLWYLTYKGKIWKNYAEKRHVDSLCVSRAFENEIILVYCNVSGKVKFSEFALGRSQITVPFIGPLKRLEHNKEEMFIQEVDMTILKEAEKSYNIREDLKKR